MWVCGCEGVWMCVCVGVCVWGGGGSDGKPLERNVSYLPARSPTRFQLSITAAAGNGRQSHLNASTHMEVGGIQPGTSQRVAWRGGREAVAVVHTCRRR